MKNIIVINTNSVDKLHGTSMQMYEIALYLQDIGYNVYYLSVTQDEKMFNSYEKRYTKNLPIYTIDTLPKLKNYYIFCYMYYIIPEILELYKKAINIHFLATDGLMNCCYKIKNFEFSLFCNFLAKTVFLYDPSLPNDLFNYNIFENYTKEEYSWGINKKYLKINDRYSDKWFIYARYNDPRMKNATNSEILEKAIAYCKNHNMEYTIDTKVIYDPWNEYKGLIYTRNIDYSPRMPFEFGYANKETICFDISDGLNTLADNVELYKPQIIKTKKELKIPLFLDKF